jgi:type II secretory pathway component PulC
MNTSQQRSNSMGVMEMQTMQTMQSVQGVYAQWTGQPVVLQVQSADLRVPLRGIIVSEMEETVRLRVEDDCDIDIYKQMILAIEEDAWMDSIT